MVFEQAWKLGSVGGVEIRIDPSWSVAAFLVGYTFFVQFSQRLPEDPPAVSAVVAAGTTVVFFACLLVHELSHAWVAIGRGVEVRGITLFLFGGSTHARLDTAGARDELVIAVVGPLSSLGLAGIWWVVAQGAGTGVVALACGRLGWINLALAVFNLVPGFPLDGGRILRAVAWKTTGDRERATRTAAAAGQTTGHVLVALGVVEVLAGGLVGGLWFMAIGWFLGQSARAAVFEIEVKRRLADVTAADIMSTHPVDLPAGLTLRRAVDDFFLRRDYNAYPVTAGRRPVGMLTLRTVRRVPVSEWPVTTVGDVMERLDECAVVDPDTPIDDVFDELTSGSARRVLVIDHGALVGLITPRDLTRWILGGAVTAATSS